jgi:hypothetical protein
LSNAVAAAVAHVEQHRVTPARQQAGERRLEVERAEVERRDVTVQVVDRRERQAPGPRERLRGGDADEERADQPRPGGDRDGLDIVERRACSCERLLDHRQHELEMPARGHFGNNTAELRVQLVLRRDDTRGDLAVGGDERSGGLVAARLDA